ncbi:chorismate mutase [Kitasatospora sp. NPDC085879]|uniref:chorismate mutase n=1 Tax=Kitasatospora sp. NPDC085879 TaxID=3154769 RepID=UPI000BB0E931|nr:chorismate mutase [Streptomyces sp. TLI_235]PBC78711.1 chorismate mutase [Streptomyces sp. TLI_235]
MRAVRGAIQVDRDDPVEVMDATRLLLREIIEANSLVPDDLVSILFTATPDLRSGFPARAARDLGLTDVPLMCAQEMDVEGGLPRTVRVLVTAETPLPRDRVRHVYLGGARALRPDLAQPMAGAR